MLHFFNVKTLQVPFYKRIQNQTICNYEAEVISMIATFLLDFLMFSNLNHIINLLTSWYISRWNHLENCLIMELVNYLDYTCLTQMLSAYFSFRQLEKSFANIEWAIFTNLWKICQIEASLRFLHKRLQLVLDLEISNNELKSML